MSRQQTHEQRMLCEAYSILIEYSADYAAQLILLEATASVFGGFDIDKYWESFGICVSDTEKVHEFAHRMKEAVCKTEIPFPLALAVLSREPIPVSEQKKNGAFYTDYRLSMLMADDCQEHIRENCKVADLSCGSGILLAGIAIKYKELFPKSFSEWLSSSVYAFDLSDNALRGTRIALSSLTNSTAIIKKMTMNWRLGDSLTERCSDTTVFDIIIGNPPWGKVKLSLHNYVNQSGYEHVYGTGYDKCDVENFENEREKALEYSRYLKEHYPLLGNAEPDLYMAFLQKALSSLTEDGHISYLVPAGIIRSQGTESLRRYLLRNSKSIEFELFDNRANFFSIDSRFKFVLVSCDNDSGSAGELSDFSLAFPRIEGTRVRKDKSIQFCTLDLEKIRPDITVPECKNDEEKRIFFKICSSGFDWGNSWNIDIAREVDMTNDKVLFCDHASSNHVPVIEGRMVQQHRFGAKTYVSGSGRSATWEPCLGGASPQYFINLSELSTSQIERVSTPRAGYCDIAGQTNERAMMSALIPSGVICGNKVPTIIFENEQQLLFWLGVTNSFVFDWAMRRIISTTINYFLLLSIPLPRIPIDGDLAQTIINNTRKLSSLKDEFYREKEMQLLRAQIDVAVAKAYGIDISELKMILEDFPLLDRKQPVIPGEKQSTVTTDLVLSVMEKDSGESHGYIERFAVDDKIGAVAYIPTEMTKLCKGGKKSRD